MSFSDEQKSILEKLDDDEWRIDSLYTIKNKWGKLVRFVRNKSQLRFWDEMWFLNIILKDRQRGFSTLIAIYILDRCFFNSHTAAGIIDITLSDAKKKLDKIKLAYDHMPEWLKATNPMTERNAENIAFQNGSSVHVGTSHRGGTLEILHVSELGKIAARNPERAREIRTGALNTLAKGNVVIYESTAEGASGEFYEECKKAQKAMIENAKLTWLDFKFHFFAWWEGTENEMDPEGIFISEEMEQYFQELENELEIKLSPRKRAWYVKKAAQQGEDMFREFPSTAEEAFQATIKGAYLSHYLLKMRKEGRISTVPYDPEYPVNTAWDLGLRDHMTIWLHQYVGMQHRIIGYIEDTDKDILHYWRKLNKDYPDYTWGRHFLPHDAGARRMGTAPKGETKPRTIQMILRKAGMKNSVIVPRVASNNTAIQEVKVWIPQCFIDRVTCKVGLSRLQNFRRDWDDKLGTWKDSYRHDEASHGYKSFEGLVRGLSIYGIAKDIKVKTDDGTTVVHTSSSNNRRAPADWRAI